MKLTLFSCLLFLMAACDPPLELDSSTRLVLKTSITDLQGNPQNDAEIQISGNDGSHFSVISVYKTKDDGKVKVAFMSPARSDATLTFRYSKENFLTTILTGFTRDDFDHYLLELPAQKMLTENDVAGFVIDLDHTGPETDEIVETHLNVMSVEDQNDVYHTFFSIGKNQDFFLYYTIRTNNGLEKHEVPLHIGEETLHYTLTY